MPSKTRTGPGLIIRSAGRHSRAGLLILVMFTALAWRAYEAVAAQPQVGLGTASSFAVLAGSAVTNVGPSTLNGELGVSPGTAITGFPPGTANGATHAADAVAGQAETDLTTAYNDAAGRSPATTVSGDLGGLTVTPGVYKSASSLELTGRLTLDAQGNPDAVFVFEAGSTLTTASASDVNLINGAQACNVYWQIGSSATLGTTSLFSGNILAYTSISINNGVTVQGRVLARSGAVTLINDTVGPSRCTTDTVGTGGGTASTTTGGATNTPGGATNGTSGTAIFTTVPRSVVTTINRHGTSRCVRRTFRVTVHGLHIRRVVFTVGRNVIATQSKSPFKATVGVLGGGRVVTAHVTFTDATHSARLHLRFRACAAAAVGTPHPGAPVIPTGFTG